MIKTSNVAGAFYPSSKEVIIQMMEEFFSNVKLKTKINNLKAIVAPHAGYIYSGQVAAYSYTTLQEYFKFKIQDSKFKIPTIVIMAPSHYEYFEGVSV
jgi:MEMO1 family protein